MENELQKSFGDGSGPLTRATLFHSQDRSVVIFATHHSSMDGKSHLLLVQDLLASIAGENLGEPLEIQAGVGQLFGVPASAEYVNKLKGRFAAPRDGSRVEASRVRLQRLQLSVEETEALIQRAREERTTVHAALIVALALAGRRYSEEWNLGPVRCISPIDVRQMLNIPEAAGLLISLHIGSVPTGEGDSFWSIARAVREDMLPDQSIEGTRLRLSGVQPLLANEWTAREFYETVLTTPLMHELMVTNYAGYRVRTEYGNLKIGNLITGSPSVTPALQKVSVLTVNGRLGLTVVARDLFPNLLEDACEILVRVSHI